jgi:hypothetical protein
LLQGTPSDFQNLKSPPMCEEGRGGSTGREERERERKGRQAPQQQQLSNACTAPAFVPPAWMDGWTGSRWMKPVVTISHQSSVTDGWWLDTKHFSIEFRLLG